MTSSLLADWLARLERRSPEHRIELGLERVAAVRQRLGIPVSPGPPVISVAGTNGKGSVVAMLEAIYCAAGYRVFAYSSPHLIDFGERLRVAGRPADDQAIVAALATVEAQRGTIELTYFEHITLAGMVLATASGADVWLLEVGLGGRLDAVNALDADLGVITSIALDHTEWLGDTRLAIGREKAGIARPGRALVVGEPDRPDGLDGHLDASGADLLLVGRDFDWELMESGFRLLLDGKSLDLPWPNPPRAWQINNAALAVVAALRLKKRLPVGFDAITQGVAAARLPGRLQCLGRDPQWILDVAHNPAAAAELAAALRPLQHPSIAIFAALKDKDISGIVAALGDCFDNWLVAELSGPRACSALELAAIVRRTAVAGQVETVESVAQAMEQALDQAAKKGRIVAFGSFYTVAEAWTTIQDCGIAN